jgi:hypothetical protein
MLLKCDNPGDIMAYTVSTEATVTSVRITQQSHNLFSLHQPNIDLIVLLKGLAPKALAKEGTEERSMWLPFSQPPTYI